MKSISIHLKSEKGNPYNTEFVKKILQGDEDMKEGKGRKISIDELNKLWKSETTK